MLGGLAAVALFAAPTVAMAEDLTFMLTNSSSLALKYFYTSPADVENWEEDVLGDNYLAAGYQVNITVADGREQCVYDMKFIMENDSEFVESGVNLCELGEYTLSDAE